MSDPAGGSLLSLPPFPCSQIVYRLITKMSWLDPDSGDIEVAAFVRRPDKDLNGLSVRICSLDDAFNNSGVTGLKRVKAVATLHVGRLRDIGLDVQPDPCDVTHAEITGIPFEADDPAGATFVAESVIAQARIVRKIDA